MQNNRLHWIDIAKVMCIILVVFGHYIPPTVAPEWYVVAKRYVYSFHMPLFMLLSGYTYSATNNKAASYCSFIKKKMLRLLLPYFSTSALVVAIKLATQQLVYVKNPITLEQITQILYYPSVCYCLWFIWVLFVFFLIIPLFETAISRLALFSISVILYFSPVFLPEVFCLHQAQGMLVYFVLGILLYDYRESFSCIKKLSESLLLFSSALVFVIVASFDFGINLNLLKALAGIAAVCLLARKISVYGNWLKKGLLWMSSSSYTIYLLHTIFIGFGLVVLKHPSVARMGDEYMQSVNIWIITMLSVACPIIVDRMILRKSKPLALLFGTKYDK